MSRTFGERLKEARQLRGLKQKELADRIGAKNTAISNWENGVNYPDVDTVALICGILHISANELLLGTEFTTADINAASWRTLLTEAYEGAEVLRREAVCDVLRIPYVDPSKPDVVSPAPDKRKETVSAVSTSKEEPSPKINKAMNIAPEEETTQVYRAARSERNNTKVGFADMPNSAIGRLRNAPEVLSNDDL